MFVLKVIATSLNFIFSPRKFAPRFGGWKVKLKDGNNLTVENMFFRFVLFKKGLNVLSLCVNK